jgi:protein gp37
VGETSIEWSQFTVNPIRARPKNKPGARSGHYCEKVSPGCKNCYSSSFQPRFGMPRFEDAEIDDLEVYLDPEVLRQVLRRRQPTKFFWCSMTDVFGRWVPDEWIAACFGVMAATPHHTHQVLTKRAERLPQWFEWIKGQCFTGNPFLQDSYALCSTCAFLTQDVAGIDVQKESRSPIAGRAAWPLSNVHVGVSVETQEYADLRIPLLRKVPAAVKFVSAEPLLGPVNIFDVDQEDGDYGPGWDLKHVEHRTDYGTGVEHDVDAQTGIDWVIVGGESGNRARDCDLAWMRSLVRQCQRAQVPVLVKQLGARPVDGGQLIQLRGSKKGGDIEEFPNELRVREFPL